VTGDAALHDTDTAGGYWHTCRDLPG
jgi:hypothetical protein